MLFASSDRYRYAVTPLVEVICQLRFPAILTIGAKDPVEFQEAIRGVFPRYAARVEHPAPKLTGLGTPNPQVEQQQPVTNHNFISSDGRWKINLTSNFIALSTVGYTQWEDFAQNLDMPLAQFIHIYQPAFFERIGLRYVNAFSRKALGMTDALWDDLIQPHLLGILGEPDVEESQVTKCALDTELSLADGTHLKLHAGPGLLNGGKQDSEVKFILDGDFSVGGNLNAEAVPGRLEALHTHGVGLFRGAMTGELHNALGPTPL